MLWCWMRWSRKLCAFALGALGDVSYLLRMIGAVYCLLGVTKGATIRRSSGHALPVQAPLQ
jgi:hypothetical protein